MIEMLDTNLNSIKTIPIEINSSIKSSELYKVVKQTLKIKHIILYFKETQRNIKKNQEFIHLRNG